MANFQTHLNVGIFVSGAAVLALHGVGLVESGTTLGYFALGVAGSLLPDIDADASNVIGANPVFVQEYPVSVGVLPWRGGRMVIATCTVSPAGIGMYSTGVSTQDCGTPCTRTVTRSSCKPRLAISR